MLTIGSPARAILGLLLLAAAAGVTLATAPLEFGIGWTAVVPALALGIPASALLRRRVLLRQGATLTITDGWLWRRATVVSLTDATLVAIPTAGLWAVVVVRQGREAPIATWVTQRTAERIAQALALPLIPAPPPSADR